MELGILERIEAKLDKLLGAESAPAEAGRWKTDRVEVAAPELTPTVEVQPELPVEESKGSGMLDDGGYEWDERIHSSNKKKTAKGIWTRRRGIDDSLYNQVIAEQTINPPEGSEEADINALDVPEAPSVPTPPAPPSPSVPTPPAVKPEDELKKKVMASIANLTTRFGVDFDKVIAQLPDNVKSFDALDSSKYQEVSVAMEAWEGWLDLCQDENVTIQTIGGQAGIDGMISIYNHYNNSTNFNQIDPSELNNVHDCLMDYRKKWEAVK